jgi:hypothetical protein
MMHGQQNIKFEESISKIIISAKINWAEEGRVNLSHSSIMVYTVHLQFLGQ